MDSSEDSEGLEDLVSNYLRNSEARYSTNIEQAGENEVGKDTSSGQEDQLLGAAGTSSIDLLSPVNPSEAEQQTNDALLIHEGSSAEECPEDANYLFIDDWIWEFVSTEAKPRKKPVRRKQKWHRRRKIEALQGAEETDKALRPVPTLSLMCAIIVKKHWTNKSQVLPRKVHSQISDLILHEYLLPCIKYFLDVQEKKMKMGQTSVKCHEGKAAAEIGRRSLYCPFNLSGHDAHSNGESEYLRNLPATQMPYYFTQKHHTYNTFRTITPYSPYYTTFAGYLNLVIPSMLKENTKQAKRLRNSDIIETTVSQVHKTLKREFPCCTDAYFDMSLPYVWWARGNKLLAEKYFRLAIARSQFTSRLRSDLYTALLNNELGRMYLNFGDRLTAVQCFAEAEKFTKYHVPQHELPATELVQNILTASAFDEGFLSSSTSQDACILWDKIFEVPGTVITTRDVHQSLASLMCFHFAHTPELGTVWWEATDRVLLKRNAYLCLSLLKAMAGYRNAAESYYNRHTIALEQPFPWSPILLATTGHHKQIHPIPMIWRRVLTHPVLEKRWKPPLFDISHDQTSLWMTDDDCLTGDFQLMLPPMPQVKLNPYTGDVVHFPSLTVPGPWKCSILPTLNCSNPDEFHLPANLRVYENSKGTVDLHIVNYVKMTNHRGHFSETIETSKLMLIWRCKGAEVRIDLKKDIRKVMRKMLDDPYFLSKHFSSNEEKRNFQEFADIYYRHGYALWPQVVHDAYKRTQFFNDKLDLFKQAITAMNNDKRKKELKQKMQQFVCMNKPRSSRFYIVLQSFASFGNAFVLSFGTSHSMKYSFYYVFNCTDRDSFRNYKSILNADREESNWGSGSVYDSMFSGIVSAPSGQGLHYPEASVFVVPRFRIYSKQQSSFTVFNEQGNELDTFVEPLVPGDICNITCVIGNRLFGVHPNRMRVVFHDVLSKTCRQSSNLPEVLLLLMIGRFLLLHTVAGVYILTEELEALQWNFTGHSVEVADEGRRIQGDFTNVKILSRDDLESEGRHGGSKVWRVLVALDDFVLFFRLYTKSMEDSVVCRTVVQVPGLPTEGCYVGEDVGFLVASTLSSGEPGPYLEEPDLHHEELYQFNQTGKLTGVLPFMGRGPHRFMPVFLPGSEEAAKSKDDPSLAHPSWHVFFFDGYGAVCCIKPIVCT